MRSLIFSPPGGGSFWPIGSTLEYGGYIYDMGGVFGTHFVVVGGRLCQAYDRVRINRNGTVYGVSSIPRRPAPHSPVHRHAQHHGHHNLHLLAHSRPNAPVYHQSAPSVQYAAEVEPKDWQEQWEGFHERHRRAIMRAQGVVDLAAGSVGVASTVLMVSALLAPETVGISVVAGAAVLGIYGLFRGFSSMGAGGAELAAASTENDAELKETDEGIEHFKTLTSVSGYVSLGVDRYVQHRPAHWRRAGFLSDTEGILGGILIPNPVTEEDEVLRIQKLAGTISASHANQLARGIKVGKKVGETADQIDKAQIFVQRGLEIAHGAKRHLKRQDNNRKGSPPATR